MEWEQILEPYLVNETPYLRNLIISSIKERVPWIPREETRQQIINNLPALISKIKTGISEIENKYTKLLTDKGIEKEVIDNFLVGKYTKLNSDTVQDLSNSTFTQGEIIKVLTVELPTNLPNNFTTDNSQNIISNSNFSLLGWRYFRKTNSKSLEKYPDVKHLKITDDEMKQYRENYSGVYNQSQSLFEEFLDLDKAMVIALTFDVTIIKKNGSSFTTYCKPVSDIPELQPKKNNMICISLIECS